MNISDLERGVPNKSDRLFINKKGNSYDYASINRFSGLNNEHTQFLIIEGYRDATIELLNQLLHDKEIDWLKIDSRIYPIVFMFRHYLEVILKDTLRHYNILNNNVQSDEVGYEKGHPLMDIWIKLKPNLEKNYAIYDNELQIDCKEKDEAVEIIISEIDNVDKDSFGFRYAYKGTKSMNEKIKYSLPTMTIDLQNLQNTIIKMINYFEGINAQVAVFLDEKQTNYGD